MLNDLTRSLASVTVLCLVTLTSGVAATSGPRIDIRNVNRDVKHRRPGLSSYLPHFARNRLPTPQKRAVLTDPTNDSNYMWVLEDTYAGQSFFDGFTFFDTADPTNGNVTYVNASEAFSRGLAWVADNGTVFMKADDTSNLAYGEYRDSVRITSIAEYNTGLFILDLNSAPWGCGVWPAFWTVNGPIWPNGGEIDIIEGVHDNQHNQVTWHTAANCTLNPNASFTGTVTQENGANNTICEANVYGGCGITEWSRASYGPYFDSQGGGVYAMKWDDTGIAVWSFYRAAIPEDITNGIPDPSGWGVPVAQLAPQTCDPLTYFFNHTIVFDITLCGDWAGNTYDYADCPGTCYTQLMNGSNFVNASWSINTLKVYKKTYLAGQVEGQASPNVRSPLIITTLAISLIVGIIGMLL